jgi:hypothetical protein
MSLFELGHFALAEPREADIVSHHASKIRVLPAGSRCGVDAWFLRADRRLPGSLG